MATAAWQDLVREPGEDRHIVQLYREPSFLHSAVAKWVRDGLASGGGVVLIAVPENAERVASHPALKGLDLPALAESGQYVVLDAEDTMARFIANGAVDGPAFKAIAQDVFGGMRARLPPGAGIRAWGEMVNVLWQRGEIAATRKLESVWNDVIASERIRLMCSYEVDNLDPDTHAGPFAHICESHSALIPEADYEGFERAVSRALVDVFGAAEAPNVRALFATRKSVPAGMPEAEAVLVAIHDTQPLLGRRLLRATRLHLASAGGS